MTEGQKNKWLEIRNEIRKFNSSESSCGWIGLLQEISKNRSRTENGLKYARAFEILDEFGKIQGKSSKYFSEIYSSVFPYCYGKDWFLYDYMKRIAYIKMADPNTIVKIDRDKRKLIIIKAKAEIRIQDTQNCLPLTFPVTAKQ